jgi:hypothetical protein
MRSDVFRDVNVPGIGNVQVMDRDTYEKAGRRAGTVLKETISRGAGRDPVSSDRRR